MHARPLHARRYALETKQDKSHGKRERQQQRQRTADKMPLRSGRRVSMAAGVSSRDSLPHTRDTPAREGRSYKLHGTHATQHTSITSSPPLSTSKSRRRRSSESCPAAATSHSPSSSSDYLRRGHSDSKGAEASGARHVAATTHVAATPPASAREESRAASLCSRESRQGHGTCFAEHAHKGEQRMFAQVLSAQVLSAQDETSLAKKETLLQVSLSARV